MSKKDRDETPISLEEQLNLFHHEIEPILERYRSRGYNIAVIMHCYDPLSMSGDYTFQLHGDEIALLGSLHRLIEEI